MPNTTATCKIELGNQNSTINITTVSRKQGSFTTRVATRRCLDTPSSILTRVCLNKKKQQKFLKHLSMQLTTNHINIQPEVNHLAHAADKQLQLAPQQELNQATEAQPTTIQQSCDTIAMTMVDKPQFARPASSKSKHIFHT